MVVNIVSIPSYLSVFKVWPATYLKCFDSTVVGQWDIVFDFIDRQVDGTDPILCTECLKDLVWGVRNQRENGAEL